ncbi:MAG: DNA sulfur modification protein DndE [Proteobacteria bacterium]|nr:DNA sulfur modification protein DndE [Pseudomonadota bacterium]MBU4259086.1 DNA sulfur modification protein DndE [Pseudomonadota bacterium]MBU4288772.1 DNA sulfur modification protein DndE [Pseudomonadota bacterium]
MELSGIEFKRIKLSQESTKKLQLFKSRTGLTPNIACRLALGISIAENNMPDLELFTEESGQEINRYTLFGEHELILTSLFLQWCHENKIDGKVRNKYFLAHINRGVEFLVNRVRGLENLAQDLRDINKVNNPTNRSGKAPMQNRQEEAPVQSYL